MTTSAHRPGQPTATDSELDLDDIVALARIAAGIIGHPLSPDQSSRLKTAWTSSHPRTLRSIAQHLDPPPP